MGDASEPRRYPRWMTFLAVVGALSIGAAILGLFFALGRRPAELDVTQAPSVEDPQFLTSLAGVAGAPLRSGGSVEILNNGDAFFPALLEAIRGARKTINFVAFIWEPGRASDQVFAALIDRARAGVEVRLLLDGYGGRRTPKDQLEALRAVGGRVASFRPPRLGKLTHFHKRIHTRAIVVDGTVAFTGGMAIGDKWLGNADNDRAWRDSMVKVTGPPATTIQSAFAAPWAHTAGEILVGERFYPTHPPESAPTRAAAIQHVGVASAPSPEDHPLRVFFMQTFLSARKTLYITTPYFVPDRVTREAVAGRARSGVDVRILLPDEHTDAKPIRQTTHSYMQHLLEAGVKFYEFQPTMMHVKHVVVDGKWVVVGSANMDIRSKELNTENVLGIFDPTFGAQMQEVFLADLKRAREIRLEEWNRRGALKRLTERACRLFAEQY